MDRPRRGGLIVAVTGAQVTTDGNPPSKRLACTVSTGLGFGSTFTSQPFDPSQDVMPTWIDAEGPR